MKSTLLVLTALVGVSLAGRAFPVQSENFVTELFQSLNPNIEWDPTNYLVDLSGPYALCKTVFNRGRAEVQETLEDGGSIGGLRDYMTGMNSDVDAVAAYIKEHMTNWIYDETFAGQIRAATRFGCSVQPGCKGYAAVACLFAPAYSGFPPRPEVKPTPPAFIKNPTAHPNALAFTPEQYDVAEQIIGRNWDRSHTLENLSGYETDCAMITSKKEWYYSTAKEMADSFGMSVEGFSSYAENKGATQPAMEEILRGWSKQGLFNKFSSNVGCSLIPDCQIAQKMWVVITCIVEY